MNINAKNLKHMTPVILIILLMSCNRKNAITPQEVSLVDVVYASGSLVPANEYQLTAMIEGYVGEIKKKEGDSVSTGETIIRIESPGHQARLEASATAYQQAKQNLDPQSPYLSSLQASIVAAKERLRNDSIQTQRFASLTSSNAISQAQYDDAYLAYVNAEAEYYRQVNNYENAVADLNVQMENAKANWIQAREDASQLTLHSGINGKVYNIFKKEGELVKRGETLAMLGSGDNLVIELQVAEEDIARIKIGQEVLVELNTEKEKVYQATVSQIYPAFNTTAQIFQVDATFIEEPVVAFSNTQLEANILIEKHENVLAIPPVYLTEGRKVKLANGTFQAVTVGIITPEWVEIKEGIEASTIIIRP